MILLLKELFSLLEKCYIDSQILFIVRTRLKIFITHSHNKLRIAFYGIKKLKPYNLSMVSMKLPILIDLKLK